MIDLLLDCFCGMGGVSDGFALEGFDVIGIDIVNAPKMLGYKYRFIQADILTLKGEDFRGYDVIWGSPPCRDFSTATQANKGYANRKPPNPFEGLKLINAFERFVEDAKPKIWLMENVTHLEHFYPKKPILRFFVSRKGRRTLWGNITFPMMNDIRLKRNMEFDYRNLSYFQRSAARSKIPLACSSHNAVSGFPECEIHRQKGGSRMTTVWVVRLKGASRPLRFFSKKSYDDFIDMLASLREFSVSVEELK